MKNRNIILQNKKSLGLFLVFGMVLSFMVVGDASAATSLTLTSSGSQDVNISPAAGTAISSDSVNVATTCRYGYNFTIQASVDDNNLYQNGDSESSVYTIFSPIDDTTPLNETENSWGYFYDGDTAPTNTSIFSPVPTLFDEPAAIITPLVTPASSDINDTFNIYYGVSAASNAEMGTYKMITDGHGNDGTIVYTATIADACTRYTVHFSPTSEFEGNTLSGTGTMNDQNIYEGVATALTSNGFTAPSGYYFAGWNTAQDGSGTQYTNSQQVTDLTTAGSSITLYAMWTDCPPNTICYSPNVSNPSDVEGQMNNRSIYNDETSLKLTAPNLKRANYGFAAWNTKPDGTGTNYGPRETIEVVTGQYSTGGLKLYAKWIASTGNIQNWSGCSSMNVGDVTALTDTRDNDVYSVAKLVDGKCWMIEDLRLDNTASHNSDGTLAQGYDPSFIGLADSESANFNDNGVANSLYSTDGSTPATVSGYSEGYRFPRYNHQTSYFRGNYYTWAAAIADTNSRGYLNQSVTTTSICPSGWRLPMGGDKNNEANNDFWALIVTGLNNGVKPADYDDTSYPQYFSDEAIPVDNALRRYPNNFLDNGYIYNSTINYMGSSGYYWTSTALNNTTANSLELGGGHVFPGDYYGNRNVAGLTIRCLVNS